MVQSKSVLANPTQSSGYIYFAKACPNLNTLLICLRDDSSASFYRLLFFFSGSHFSQSCLLMHYTKQHKCCFWSPDWKLCLPQSSVNLKVTGGIYRWTYILPKRSK